MIGITDGGGCDGECGGLTPCCIALFGVFGSTAVPASGALVKKRHVVGALSARASLWTSALRGGRS